MSRNPNEGQAAENPSVTGAIVSGNARLRVRGRVVTTGGPQHSVTGVSTSGDAVVVLGDVVTIGNSTTVTGGISVRGTGRVEVGGRVIENGVDITETISVVQRNLNVQQTQAQRFIRPPSPVEISITFDGRINFKEINENIQIFDLRETAPESAKLRLPRDQSLNITEQLKRHPRVISVNGERTPQGEVMMAKQSALPAMRAMASQ